MKIRRVLAIAVLLAVPVWAQAQVVAQDGQRTDPDRRGTGQGMVVGGIDSDTLFRIPRYDASGNALMSDASRDRDASFELRGIINNFGAVALAIGVGDSSQVQDTRHMRLGMLVLKAVVAGTGTVDTTVAVRIAVQIRTHLGGVDDSMSTAPIYFYGSSTAGAGADAHVDTTVQGHIYNATSLTGVSATPTAWTSWSGEQTFIIHAKRNAHGSAVAINGHTHYYPNAIAIPLASLFGREPYSRYTSVRIRVMSAHKGAATFSTATLFVEASLIGSPL